MQTVEIKFPFSELTHNSIEYCPRLPDDIHMKLGVECDMVTLQTDENTTTWYSDGRVTRELPDSTLKTWFPRPTFSDAVHMATTAVGSFYHFYKDGTVECRFMNYLSIWLPGANPEIESGDFKYSCNPHLILCYCGNETCDRDCGVQSCGCCIDTCRCD
jgi:hypothetical protein